MIVCVCHRVSDKTIAQSARMGFDFTDIQLEHGVATQCGKCETCARAIWQECLQTHAVVHLHKESQEQAVVWG